MIKSQKEFKLGELKGQALTLMEQAGYTFNGDISVQLDETLPYMGYTTQHLGKPIIVVSGNAMNSGMAINLMIHELSHVYRSQSNHPSHNYQLLTNISGWVMQGKVIYDYQEKIVHTIINHLQDLYADDISFRIFKKQKEQPDLSRFFLSWIHEPSKATDPLQKVWENADALVSTAFAQANLERHKVKDTEGKVDAAVNAFLKQLEKPYTEKYTFFKTFMIHMPEEISDKEFEKLLIKYLNEFSKLLK